MNIGIHGIRFLYSVKSRYFCRYLICAYGKNQIFSFRGIGRVCSGGEETQAAFDRSIWSRCVHDGEDASLSFGGGFQKIGKDHVGGRGY